MTSYVCGWQGRLVRPMSSGTIIQVIVLGEVACQRRNRRKNSQSRGVFRLGHAIRLFGLNGRFLQPRPQACEAVASTERRLDV